MAKIRVETEVPDSKYCDKNPYCPMCQDVFMGVKRCALFGVALEKVFTNSGYHCERCDECKQAEVEDNDTL